MNKSKKESFFWTSYSDLMTSLFFVMLVLFVLVIVLLHNKIKATQDQINKIKEIEESVKNIDSDYFQYDARYKRHTLKNINVSFKTGSSNISDIPSEQLSKLEKVGRSIKKFIDTAVSKNANVKYLLIVEGQSSKDTFIRNDELSYERALALVKYWKGKGKELHFDDKACEVLISGSGQDSKFRVEPDTKDNKANQRFVIHIIPKTGVLDSKDDTK